MLIPIQKTKILIDNFLGGMAKKRCGQSYEIRKLNVFEFSS